MNEKFEKLILEIDALLAEVKLNSVEPESLFYWQDFMPYLKCFKD